MPVGQVKLDNNLPEVISACLGQALILNPIIHHEYMTDPNGKLSTNSICRFNRLRASGPKLPARKPMEEPPERQQVKNKQCEKKILLQDSNLQPFDYWYAALPLELERMSLPLELNNFVALLVFK